MPRGSTGAYVAPSGTTAVSGQTIAASSFNTLETDIGSEITNSVDRLGRGGMLAALPMNSNKITGMADPSNAQDAVTLNYLNTTFSPLSASVSGWLGYTPANKAGDTFLGGLTVAPAAGSGQVILSKTSTTGMANSVYGETNGLLRWGIALGEGTAESGANSGSNFTIASFTDAGSSLSTPFTITRSTGLISITAGLSVQNGLTITGSSTFSASPTLPTPVTSDNSTSGATTAFVNAFAAQNNPWAVGTLAIGTTASVIAAGSSVAGNTINIYGANAGGGFTPGAGTTWICLGAVTSSTGYCLWKRIS